MPLSYFTFNTRCLWTFLKTVLNTSWAQPSDNHTSVFEPQTVQEAVNRALWGDCRDTNDTFPNVEISTASSTSKADWLNKKPLQPIIRKEHDLCVLRDLSGRSGTTERVMNVFSGRWSLQYTVPFSCVLGPVGGIWHPFSASLFWLQRHHVTFPFNAPLTLSLQNFSFYFL